MVCRKLRLTGGRALRDVSWGATGLRVGISNVRCLGFESELRCAPPHIGNKVCSEQEVSARISCGP